MTLEELYQCEICDGLVAESDAKTETVPGFRETITLAFCPGCSE